MVADADPQVTHDVRDPSIFCHRKPVQGYAECTHREYETQVVEIIRRPIVPTQSKAAPVPDSEGVEANDGAENECREDRRLIEQRRPPQEEKEDEAGNKRAGEPYRVAVGAAALCVQHVNWFR